MIYNNESGALRTEDGGTGEYAIDGAGEYGETGDPQLEDQDGRPTAAFLLAANDLLTAEAYEHMLKKNGVEVVAERLEPKGPYAALSVKNGALGAPVNLYVSSMQLDLARRLVDAFDNQPVQFDTPPPVLNQKSRVNQIIFAIVVVLIFVIPIGVSILVIGQRIFNSLNK